MQIKPETVDDIVWMVAQKFRSMGGGQMSNYNPIVNAMSEKPFSFALGVDIKEVVKYVLEQSKHLKNEKALQ